MRIIMPLLLCVALVEWVYYADNMLTIPSTYIPFYPRASDANHTAHEYSITDVNAPYGGYDRFVELGLHKDYLPLWLQRVSLLYAPYFRLLTCA